MITKTKRSYSILLLLFVILAGCNSNTVITPIYNGRNLSIGVIGTPPMVREKNIKFTKINFRDLLNPNKISSHFNAIFITKENLSQASQNQYVQIYRQLTIPTFFIQSEKSYMPFIMKNLSYEDAPKVDNLMYATGILQDKKGLKSWGYGLYNNTVNDTNIRDVYTRIFSTIEKEEQQYSISEQN